MALGPVPFSFLGGYRIFPERNHPEGTTDQFNYPIDQVHDQVNVRVTINPPMPADYSLTVHIKVFDPDYFQDGGQSHTPDDGDPNEHDPNTHAPNDNFGGLGMTPAVNEMSFSAGESQETATFTIDEPKAGNNFLMGVHHSSTVLNKYHFMPDGRSLYIMHQGQQMAVPPPYRSDNWLTVWRSLWMELDDMVAPAPAPQPAGDGPFDGEGTGNDDVILDPDTPPIALTESSMQRALVEIKVLPAVYNTKDAMPNDATGTVEFLHNLTAVIASTKSAPVRDVDSEAAFWVVHTIGAYEEASESDWDPNAEANSWLGWAYQYGADGSNFIFYETIRDRQLNDALPNPPTPVDVSALTERVVLHEALHRFLGPHGGSADTGVQEGVMVYDIAIYGAAQQCELTPRQIREINQREYPK